MIDIEQTILGALGIEGANRTTPAEVIQTMVESVVENLVMSGLAAASGGAGEIAKSAAKSVLGSMPVASLVSGIVGLFTGGGEAEPAALAEYTAPPPVDFEGASAPWPGQPIRAVSYDQYGQPRAQNATAPFFAPTITVQVQAMDSRSFLDHSDDIAMAVREAILNGHALGGVMSES
jgi:hypothetical protein